MSVCQALDITHVTQTKYSPIPHPLPVHWHFHWHFQSHKTVSLFRLADIRHPLCATRQAPGDERSIEFIPPAPRLWLLRRNLAPAGEESFPVCACCHSVAEAPLPGGAGAGGCVSSGAALLSGGRGEDSSSAPSERNAKHEHDRRPHHHRMPRSRSAANQKSGDQLRQLSLSAFIRTNRPLTWTAFRLRVPPAAAPRSLA